MFDKKNPEKDFGSKKRKKKLSPKTKEKPKYKNFYLNDLTCIIHKLPTAKPNCTPSAALLAFSYST